MIRIIREGDLSPSSHERKYISNYEFDIETIQALDKVETVEDILNETNLTKQWRQ
tara:strand:- start:1600 stop:1764 length:165 start_codon:yes stop_codon:yes gene_type:complete